MCPSVGHCCWGQQPTLEACCGIGETMAGNPKKLVVGLGWWRSENRSEDLGGEPQPLVLCVGHGNGGTEVDVFSQGLSRDDLRES